jgi:hypothetical protein
MVRDQAARRKELRSHDRRARKQEKLAARRAARQARKEAGALGQPAAPEGGQ